MNPQYHLPDHDYSSPPEIYREYMSSGDQRPIDHTHHFYNPHRPNYLDIKKQDMHTTYTHCNITRCSCNQSLAQSQIQHPQLPTNNPTSTISQPPNKSPNPKQHPLPKKSPELMQLPKVKQSPMPKKDPKETPRPKQTQTPITPLHNLPVPPKVQTNLQIPKNLPFPKNLRCPRRSPRKPP